MSLNPPAQAAKDRAEANRKERERVERKKTSTVLVIAMLLSVIAGMVMGGVITDERIGPRKITDELPPRSTPVIVICPGGKFDKAYLNENDHFIDYCDGKMIGTVTHWQPITR